MDEILIVKLERIANAFEKMADSLSHIAVALDKQSNALEKSQSTQEDEKVEELRKKHENHFAKVEWEVKANRNGTAAVVRQDSSGQNFIMLCVHNPKYGYSTMFIKHKRVANNWAQTLKMVDQVGVKFICNAFISWNDKFDNIKPRWTVNFLAFSRQAMQGTPAVNPDEAVVPQNDSGDGVDLNSDTPY